MTNAEVVSRITNGLRLLNKDARFSKRYLLFVAEKNAEYLISHKLRDRSLFREDNVYSSISCFELEEKDTYSCGIVEFKSCNKLMKSKEKLPNIVYSRYGSSIRQVTPIDFMSDEEFTPTTLEQFKRDRRRQNKFDKTNKFIIKDGYLYIPESEIRAVSLELIIINTFRLSYLNSEYKKDCRSAWDYEFKISDKIAAEAINMTIQELSRPVQIPEDSNPNMDSNIKSRA